jgi:hypothetical protein
MEDALLADRTGVGRGRQGSVRPSKLHSLDFKVDFVVNRVSQTRKTLESGGGNKLHNAQEPQDKVG